MDADVVVIMQVTNTQKKQATVVKKKKVNNTKSFVVGKQGEKLVDDYALNMQLLFMYVLVVMCMARHEAYLYRDIWRENPHGTTLVG